MMRDLGTWHQLRTLAGSVPVLVLVHLMVCSAALITVLVACGDRTTEPQQEFSQMKARPLSAVAQDLYQVRWGEASLPGPLNGVIDSSLTISAGHYLFTFGGLWGTSNYLNLWVKACGGPGCVPPDVSTKSTSLEPIWEVMIGHPGDPMVWPMNASDYLYHGVAWTVILRRETYVMRVRAYDGSNWQPWSKQYTIRVVDCTQQLRHLPEIEVGR